MSGGDRIMVKSGIVLFGRRKYNRGRHFNQTWTNFLVKKTIKRIFFLLSKKKKQKNSFEYCQQKMRNKSFFHTDKWKSYMDACL